MKHLLLVAAVVAAAPAAMASKARVEALGGSRNVVDFQTAFDRPYQFLSLGEQVTIEWGSNDDKTAATLAAPKAHAEGGFVKKHNDSAVYGAYLGRRSDAFNNAVGAAATASGATYGNALLEQNPLNLFYATKTGEITWGATVKYSNGKDEATDAKSNSAGIALGAKFGAWDFDLTQGLTAKSEIAGSAVESKGMTEVSVGYHLNENMEVYGTYGMIKADADIGGGTVTVLDAKSYSVGFVNEVLKNEEINFFYGIAYSSTKIENSDETTALPVWMGVEASASSWLVLRASVSQNIILNEVKASNGQKKDLDSVNFAAGAGLKFGKSMIDASFGTAKAGHLSFSDGAADQFLSNVAYTYTF